MTHYLVPIDELRYPFLRPLFEKIDEIDTTMISVSRKAGYADGTLSRWRCGSGTPKLPALLDILESMDLELKIVPRTK